MRRSWSVAGALLAALALGACSGADCEDYCTKMADCFDELGGPNNRDCDRQQCIEFCEHALDIDAPGVAGSVACAVDASCNELRDGACFPYGAQGARWCR